MGFRENRERNRRLRKTTEMNVTSIASHGQRQLQTHQSRRSSRCTASKTSVIRQIQHDLKERNRSAQEITQQYLQTVAQDGPSTINSFLTVQTDRALAQVWLSLPLSFEPSTVLYETSCDFDVHRPTNPHTLLPCIQFSSCALRLCCLACNLAPPPPPRLCCWIST